MGYTVDGKDFAAYKTITPTRPTAALTDYPLKVGIVADANVGGRCLSTGADVRFTLADGTLLYSEKNDFLITAGAATGNFWVNVPSLPSDADTVINMYYGCPTAAAQANPELTWNANYAAVYHCEQDPSGAAPQVLDSTANAKHLTTVGTMTTGDLVAAKVGSGLDLDGTNDGAWGDLWTDQQTNVHMTYWELPTAGIDAEQMAMHNGVDMYGWGAGICGTSRAALFDMIAWCFDGLWSGGVWDHIAWGRDATTWAGYLNGAVVDGWTSTTGVRNPVTCSSIGFVYPNIRPVTGVVDELRMLLIAPSTPLIAYDYLTQNTAAGGLTWGAEQAANMVRSVMVIG